MSVVIKIILIGVGATFIVDIWIFLLGLFKIKSLDYRFVGRWISNLPRGKFFHNNIMNIPPAKGELYIGWTAHYLIGVTFAFLLVIIYGTIWLDEPQVFPAVITGIITVTAPLFIMQPAFGFGIASSKLPKPNQRIFKSLLTHLVYGLGLYITALLIKNIWN